MHTISGLLWCILFGGLAVGCISEDYEGEHTEGGIQSTSYISLSLMSAPGVSTRANPTGGENGDGEEKGQDYENRISSAVVFFYQDDDGINGSQYTPIKAVAKFTFAETDGSDGNGTTTTDRVYTTGTQQIDLENGTYHVLVVANPGADWWSGKSLTLGEVRNYIQAQAWRESESESGTEYSDFVMTSAGDATLILASNPQNDPAKVTVHVERMAARLDYKAEASYICTDPAYSEDTVEIVGAALVNNLTAGSYLMKRVADNVSGLNLSYLGFETADAQGIATNYVLDPWTASKTETNNSFTIGSESGRPASDLYGAWFENQEIYDNPKWWADYVKPGTEVSDGTNTWHRIGYTLENTTDAAMAGTRYSTGVVFKATFHPKNVANYKDGSTFFTLGSHIFASIEKMMTYVYGIDFEQFDSKIESCESWEDVNTFAATLLDNDPSGYKAFLKDQVAKYEATTDFADVKGTLKWNNYMLAHCGYSASVATDDNTYIVRLDQNNLVSRQVLQSFGVRTYENATCYYTWWVRHSNDNNDTQKGIMEYAIVRNNIYKLTVNSIYSLGGETPAPSENIILDVYVNDWLLLDEEELPM